MNVTYSSVREPRWADEAHTGIICTVKFDHLKNEAPFSARPDDTEPHGREIFHRAASGEFGPVAPHEPQPQQPSPAVHPPAEVRLPGWPQLQEFLAEANAENAKRSLRGVVLTWSSMIDDMLASVLEAFFIDHSVSRELASNTDLTFSMRIKLAFALGLIDHAEFTACDNIRNIRNFFAHQWQANPENPEFRKKALPAYRSLYDCYFAKLYNFSDDIDFLTRAVFGGASGTIAFALAKRIVQAQAQRRVTPTS